MEYARSARLELHRVEEDAIYGGVDPTLVSPDRPYHTFYIKETRNEKPQPAGSISD